MIFFRRFIFLGLTFMSLIQSELKKKKLSKYHSFTCSFMIFMVPLIEETVFSLLYILASHTVDN